MAEPFRIPAHSVLVPGRVCAFLVRHVNLARLHDHYGPTDAQAAAVLRSIRSAALDYANGSCSGTIPAAEPEPGPAWYSTGQAAERLAMTDRGVRKAILAGHLPAENVNGRWRITADDLDTYRRARKAS
ncbi:helix-turn-helix domain-containing protein [Microbacterium sp. NPDC078428]|uniref:helix-turn-helix domain-containing protein n=1 Tax=Microbacterium sp. NPDC078428 TaxID=3364190 RepID=UPI0037C50E7E